jgi:hypothetical protein
MYGDGRGGGNDLARNCFHAFLLSFIEICSFQDLAENGADFFPSLRIRLNDVKEAKSSDCGSQLGNQFSSPGVSQ